MAGLEGNKILGAVLLGATVFVGANFVVSDLMFGDHGHHFEPAKHYELPEGAVTQVASAAPVEKVLDPISPLLVSADIANGQAAFKKKCATCHVAVEGAKLKVGPNLWQVVGRNSGESNFAKYSSGFKKRGPVAWSYEELNGFLHKPKTYIKGTSMAFSGLRKEQERADVIAYLRTLSDNPEPLPAQ